MTAEQLRAFRAALDALTRYLRKRTPASQTGEIRTTAFALMDAFGVDYECREVRERMWDALNRAWGDRNVPEGRR